jgi:predicted branched-subunit amino acid permease
MLGVNVPQHSIWNFIASVGVILGMTIGIGAVALQVVYQGLEVREQSKIMKREEQARSRYK